MAAAATTAAYKDEPNPKTEYCPSPGRGGHGSGGSSLPAPPASTEVESSSAGSENSNGLTPEQPLHVESKLEKDVRQIRRKRRMLLSITLHLAVLVLVNAVTWWVWAYNPTFGSQSEPPTDFPGGPPMRLPFEVEDEAEQINQFLPPAIRGEIHERPHAPCPWPAWVSFGTVSLFFFHAANLLPLVMTKRQSGCPHWNYWVLANMAGVVGMLWAVFLLAEGPEHHEFPWPIIFTSVALGTCLITTSISCLSGVMKRFVEGG